jgi:hypothetical protein
MALSFPTRAERPGSQPHAQGFEDAWPQFLYHDPVLNRLFGRVIEEHPEFQFYAWDDEREEVVGVGNAVSATWDGDPASLPDGGVDAVVEEWAGMSFPESGSYVVPGALVPVEIDRERDEGLYVEPNVWMVHPPG